MASANLAIPIYNALIGNAGIAAALPTYNGGVTVFTNRPVPADAPYPLIVADEVTGTDEDLINTRVDRIFWDVSVYGQNDTSAHSRAVKDITLAVRDLFHRNRASIYVPGWDVMDIIAGRPIVAPVDDDTTTGRVLTLNIRLSEA